MKLSDFFNHEIIIRDAFFSQIDEVDTAMQDSFVYCLNAKYLDKAINNPKVTCILTTPELSYAVVKKGLVVASDPRIVFFGLYNRLTNQGMNNPGMDFGIGTNSTIHPSAVLSDKVKIGDNVVIGANTVIESYTRIGDNTYIGTNATIGAEGFITVDENCNRIFIVFKFNNLHKPLKFY